MGGESGVERYPVRSDELIVALPESAEVLRTLDELGARERTVEDSTVLGLSRITVPDVHGLAEAVHAKADATPGAGALVPAPRPTDRDIDRVLGGLRAIFKARYQGWSPRIGKNRLVGHLQGVGEISHGGTGDPQPTEPAVAPAARADAPGEGVRVGVLDTAVHPHPWLAGGWTARSSDVIPGGDVPSYAGGHATFVAGLILGQAPGAVLDVRQVLQDDGADSWTVAHEIVLAGRRGLDVLNLSFVCYTEDGEPPLVLATAVDRLPTGLVVVAAAGNHADDGSDEPQQCPGGPDCAAAAWPAALDDVVAVGAATQAGGLVPFSPAAPWIDLRAPGDRVTSTYLPAAVDAGGATVRFDSGFATWSGTSFSAALVSGAVAARTEPGVSALEALAGIRRSVATSSQPPGYLKLRMSF